jgi:hypothetical protein
MEALAVPTNEGSRLHDHQSPAPVKEPAELDQGDARGVVDTSGFDLAFLILSQLFAQEEILCGQDECWSQTQHDKPSRIEQNG